MFLFVPQSMCVAASSVTGRSFGRARARVDGESERERDEPPGERRRERRLVEPEGEQLLADVELAALQNRAAGEAHGRQRAQSRLQKPSEGRELVAAVEDVEDDGEHVEAGAKDSL